MGIKVERRRTIDYDVMRQVDRAEDVAVVYEARPLPIGLGLGLQRIKQEPVMIIPSWREEGIRKRIEKWQPELDNGGSMLVALQEDKAVGFGITGPKQGDGSVELCALFVGSGARQSGVGTILFRQLEEIAREQGARSLLIYSNPTESAVDFYLRQGCELIGLADKRLVSRLPWDVVFAKSFQVK